MGTVNVNVNAINVLRIAIASNMVPSLKNENSFSSVEGFPRKNRSEQTAANN